MILFERSEMGSNPEECLTLSRRLGIDTVKDLIRCPQEADRPPKSLEIVSESRPNSLIAPSLIPEEGQDLEDSSVIFPDLSLIARTTVIMSEATSNP